MKGHGAAISGQLGATGAASGRPEVDRVLFILPFKPQSPRSLPRA